MVLKLQHWATYHFRRPHMYPTVCDLGLIFVSSRCQCQMSANRWETDLCNPKEQSVHALELVPSVLCFNEQIRANFKSMHGCIQYSSVSILFCKDGRTYTFWFCWTSNLPPLHVHCRGRPFYLMNVFKNEVYIKIYTYRHIVHFPLQCALFTVFLLV